MKKGQSLSLNTLIIVVLILIVLVVTIVVFVGNINSGNEDLNNLLECTEERGGECQRDPKCSDGKKKLFFKCPKDSPSRDQVCCEV